MGVGQVEVTLEQYYWLPDDAKTDDPANYDPGTPGKDGTGQGRWVLNDLEYKTTRSTSAGSYIFKGVST